MCAGDPCNFVLLGHARLSIFTLQLFPKGACKKHTKYATIVLGVENYGLVAMSRSIISYFILIAGLGIEVYAVREGSKVRDKKDEFSSFANEVFSINIISTIFSFALLITMSLTMTGVIVYRTALIVLSLKIWLTTLGTEWINTVFEDFTYITIRSIAFQIIALLLMVMFVHDKSDYLIYCGITVLASSGGDLVNVFYIRKYTKLKFTKSLNLQKHLMPILLLFFNAIMTTIYLHSDVTILGIIKGNSAVAIYDIASKIYMSLKQVLVAFVAVLIPQVSKAFGEDNLKKVKELLIGINRVTFPFLLSTIVYIVLFSRVIICIVSGEAYAEGSVALKILSFAVICAYKANMYLNCIILASGNDRGVVLITIITALVNVGLNVLLIPFFSYNAAAATTLFAEFLTAVVSYSISNRIVQLGVDFKTLRVSVLLCIPVIAVYLISCNWPVAKTISRQGFNSDLITLFTTAPVVLLVNGVYYLFRKRMEK